MSDAAFIKLYKWLAGGRTEDEPSVGISKTSVNMTTSTDKAARAAYENFLKDIVNFNSGVGSTELYAKLNWKAEVGENKQRYGDVWPLGAFFVSLESNFDNLIYAGPDTSSEEFFTFVDQLAQITGNSNVSVDMDGQKLASLAKVINKATSALTSGLWDDIWKSRSKSERALIIFEYLKIKVLTGKIYPGEGVADGDMFIPYYVKDGTPETDSTLNPIKLETKSIFNLGSGFAGFFGFSSPDAPLLKDAEKLPLSFYKFPSLLNTLFLQDTGISTASNLQSEIQLFAETGLEAGKPEGEYLEALRAIGAKNLAVKGAIADLSTILEDGDEGKSQRDAFFRKIEQCILLTSVNKLGEYRRNIRQEEYMKYSSDTSGSTYFPYGGKIICTKNINGSFINFSNTDDNLYNYTTKLIKDFDSIVNHEFTISKLNTIKTDHGTYEIEMPLMFEQMKNILNKNLTGPAKEPKYLGTKVFVKKKPVNDVAISTMMPSLTEATPVKENIKIENVSIKFEGENQATAKSNVDVELTIEVGDLMLLQSVFESYAYYIDDDGEERQHRYEYQLIDLLTYLHRSDLGDVFDSLTTEGGRLYNPVYFKNYNRLIMKLIPQPMSAPQIAQNGDAAEAFGQVSSHHEATPLILDLALIDHSIKKKSKDNAATITVTYKGYIRSFMQDPKFDVLRNYEEIKKEIENERKLIEGDGVKKGLKDLNGEKAIKLIDEFNKDKEANFTRPKSIPYLNTLISRNKYYSLEIDGSSFVDNVTKEYQLLNSNIINSKITDENISDVLGQIKETQDPIVDTAERGATYDIRFFYFGDLIDAMMQSMYKYEGGTEGGTYYDTLRPIFKRFPIKVILPSFKPLMPSSDGKSYVRSTKDISVADFPIAETWFTQWWTKEVLDSEVSFYTIGTLITRLVNELLNGLLLEDCYLNGSHERIQFAIKSDFGLFDRKFPKSNPPDNLFTEFDNVIEDTGPVDGFLDMERFKTLRGTPYFFKDAKTPRSQYCNFIVVYKQLAVFEDYKGVSTTEESRKENNLPIFHFLKTNDEQLDNKATVFTESIDFAKQESTYMRESRFQADNLSTLSQIASVYDATCTSKQILSLFPGMVAYIDAGLYQSPEIYNSIANILGLGGLHIIQSVEHKGNVEGNKIDITTTTSCVWISNDTIRRNNVVIKGGTEEDPKPPEGEVVLMGGATLKTSTKGKDGEKDSDTPPPKDKIKVELNEEGVAESVTVPARKEDFKFTKIGKEKGYFLKLDPAIIGGGVAYVATMLVNGAEFGKREVIGKYNSEGDFVHYNILFTDSKSDFNEFFGIYKKVEFKVERVK